MAVTAARTRKEPGYVDVELGTKGRLWQAWKSISLVGNQFFTLVSYRIFG